MMKSLVKIALVLAVLAALGTAVHAEPFRLKASVPFPFTAGGKTLPAGDYTISPLAGFPAYLLIEGADPGAKSIVFSRSTDAWTPPRKDTVVFSDSGVETALVSVTISGRMFEITPAPTTPAVAVSLRSK
jgi:hypothetical protein